ncbi:MAG: hypothetical protein KC731_11230 [Myxococcales bacterium]|nr:hypothetical protein [Myxococcales bacterium]
MARAANWMALLLGLPACAATFEEQLAADRLGEACRLAQDAEGDALREQRMDALRAVLRARTKGELTVVARPREELNDRLGSRFFGGDVVLLQYHAGFCVSAVQNLEIAVDLSSPWTSSVGELRVAAGLPRELPSTSGGSGWNLWGALFDAGIGAISLGAIRTHFRGTDYWLSPTGGGANTSAVAVLDIAADNPRVCWPESGTQVCDDWRLQALSELPPEESPPEGDAAALVVVTEYNPIEGCYVRDEQRVALPTLPATEGQVQSDRVAARLRKLLEGGPLPLGDRATCSEAR